MEKHEKITFDPLAPFEIFKNSIVTHIFIQCVLVDLHAGAVVDF